MLFRSSQTLIVNVKGQDRRFIHLAGANKVFRAEHLARPAIARAKVFYFGGYLLTPERWEFWQGRANRLHDRFEYLPHGSTWEIRRLQP